jgi:hypothetical protein
MKPEKMAIWASLPLSVVGLVASFLTLVAGAGHGDKSLVLFIFPLPAFAWAIGGFVIGLVAALHTVSSVRFSFSYRIKTRLGGWPAAAVILFAHFSVVFWILRSG